MWLILISHADTIYIDDEILKCVEERDSVCTISYEYFERANGFLEEGRYDSAYVYYSKSYRYIRNKPFRLWKVYLLSLVAYSGSNYFKFFDALEFDKEKYLSFLEELDSISLDTPLRNVGRALRLLYSRPFVDRFMPADSVLMFMDTITVPIRFHRPRPVFVFLHGRDSLLNDYINYLPVRVYAFLFPVRTRSFVSNALERWYKSERPIIKENAMFYLMEFYFRSGHHEIARAYLRNHINLFFSLIDDDSTMKGELFRASYYNTLGDMYNFYLGDDVRAIAYYRRSLRILDSLNLRRGFAYAVGLNNLGMAYKSTGDYDRAIDYLREALRLNAIIFSDTGQSVSNVMSNLSRAFALAGIYDSAIYYTRKSIEIRKNIYGEDNDLVLLRRLELADLYLSTGDTSDALDIVKWADSTYPRIKYYFYPRYDIAEEFLQLYSSLGYTGRALWYARELLSDAYPVPDYVKSRIRLDYLKLLVEQGKSIAEDTILYHISMSRREIEGYMGYTFRWVKKILDEIYRKFLDIAPYLYERHLWSPIISYGELLKGRLLSLEVDFSRDHIVDSLRRSLYLALQEGRSLEELVEIESRISDRIEESRHRFRFEKIPTISENTVLIGYLLSDSLLISYDLTDRDTLVHLTHIGRDSLNRMVEHFLENPGGYDVSHRLYELLLSPFENMFKGKERVAISPAGPLYNLPFEILHDGSRYVVEKPFSTFYLLSFHTYDEPCRVEGDVLAMGRNDYGNNPVVVRSGLGNLTFAEREAREVAELMGGKYIIGDSLQEEKLYSMNLGEFSLLHFATHAIMDTQPSIVLGPRRDTISWRDNILTMDEVYGRLRAGKAVVLSGCRTGHGQLINDREGIANLTRAFIYTGARCIITSAWDISDMASYVFMREFYKQLKKREPIDVALKKARIYMLRETGLSNPFFWGGYMLTVFRR